MKSINEQLVFRVRDLERENVQHVEKIKELEKGSASLLEKIEELERENAKLRGVSEPQASANDPIPLLDK